MEQLIRVGITQGDFNGVGLEVALKALANETILELMTPVLFADSRLVEYARRTLGLELPPLACISDASEADDGRINVVDLRLKDTAVHPGVPDAASGAGAVSALDAAMQAIADGNIDVLVTAPISKEAAQSESFSYAGHTEYLGAKAGAGYVPQMILFDDRLRVALVTTHLPIAKIPQAITKEKVADSVTRFASTLVSDFGIVCPKIAVLSLNPHSGDGGLLGREEQEVIHPAIEQCVEQGILAFGPFAADGFFGSGAFSRYDGILAMYHDQGLAPFKTLSGSSGVNFTAGLPFVRTSPDHGTACDLAWKGEADETSMREAIYRAIDIFRNRLRYRQASANPLKKTVVERPSKGEKAGQRPDPRHKHAAGYEQQTEQQAEQPTEQHTEQ